VKAALRDARGCRSASSTSSVTRQRWESPEQFRQTVRADRQEWAAVVKEVGATID